MISIKNLTKRYDDRDVISSLCLDFREGEIVAICGPSGCGKTTLLRIIAGIERKSSGTVEFGIPKPTFSITFQEPCLLEHRNSAQNVNLVLGDTDNTLWRANELLLELGIENPALFPDELSGGMRARVGIARALAPDSSIYLFDEPFANLDRATALRVAEVIKRHTTGKTVLCIIHDKELAAEFANRIIKFDTSPLSNQNMSEIHTHN